MHLPGKSRSTTYVTLQIHRCFQSEVYIVVGLGMFLPICLEQFARDNGYLLPDKTERCTSALKLSQADESARCVVKILWMWIDTASFRCAVSNHFACVCH
jgi:MFS transporter, UMF1 family